MDDTLCLQDELESRALNAEADLEVWQDRLEIAVGDYERSGDRHLLLERLYGILGENSNRHKAASAFENQPLPPQSSSGRSPGEASSPVSSGTGKG